MFTAEQRDRVREQLLARAEADSAVTGAAFTGSHATGDGDRWSDTDLVLAVHGDVAPVLIWAVRHHRRRDLLSWNDTRSGASAARLRPMLAELAGSD